MKRLGMAAKLEQPERRWATVQALEGRGRAGRSPKNEILPLLETFLDDENERVRVAAAAARTRLGDAGEADGMVLAKAGSSKDPWVRWVLDGLKKR